MTLRVLAEKGTPNTAIARTLGVSEGTVRYHRRRAAEGAVDGRKGKPRTADRVRGAIVAWMAAAAEVSNRPPNIQELHEHLVRDHAYVGSYKSVLRYVRAHYPPPPIRTYRRVETPPGAQSQTDWAEYPRVRFVGGVEPRDALVMTLSYSRMPAVVWSRGQDQLSWLRGHNEAYRRLGGVAAVNRIDNVRTGIASGAGAWGVINPVYRAYARVLRFHVDACEPRAPHTKGKAEAKVRLTRLVRELTDRVHADDAELQAVTDARILAWAMRAVCPLTGESVYATWEKERRFLSPLPEPLPEPFDVVVTRPVRPDCLVHFEGREYPIPFYLADRRVEIRGGAGTVEIYHEGKRIRCYPRGTAARRLQDESCYEGEARDGRLPPPPLGRMGRKLREIAEMPVETRPVDLYAALMEVAR